MELSELVRYAAERYGIAEDHKWDDFPGFSVLCDPSTGKWLALLMRQPGPGGVTAERCDIRCGKHVMNESFSSFLSSPFRMRGERWVGVTFGPETDPETVFRLFDRAYDEMRGRGSVLVLDDASRGGYEDTPLPPAGSVRRREDDVPERIRQMRRLYRYGSGSFSQKVSNFVLQASFMEDYEDDRPYSGYFMQYFPTYHDLSTSQLRGYFTWRTRVRKGIYEETAASFVYIYLYELLNGIGASSPLESIRKMRELETEYLDRGMGDRALRQNIKKWMTALAVINDIPAETVPYIIDEDLRQRDMALDALREPFGRTDGEVFSALDLLYGGKLSSSPVVTASPERGMKLFASCWRNASVSLSPGNEDFFTSCFGHMLSTPWEPVTNALFRYEPPGEKRIYCLTPLHRFIYPGSGIRWTEERYDKVYFNRTMFRSFLREADTRLRRYLSTGRYLKEDPAGSWAASPIEEAVEDDRREQIEASRPKITIDLSGLDRIREDAAMTERSLMTEEELSDGLWEDLSENVPEELSEERPGASETGRERKDESPTVPESLECGIPLDPVYLGILRTLASGGDASGIISEKRIIPSVAADTINEALLDVIGDSAVDCDGDRLYIIEDYLQDICELTGVKS